MVLGKKMQNPYGSTESERVDGTAVSSFVSWDSKVTTVAALLGGVSDLVKRKMMKDGIYREFIKVTKVSRISMPRESQAASADTYRCSASTRGCSLACRAKTSLCAYPKHECRTPGWRTTVLVLDRVATACVRWAC